MASLWTRSGDDPGEIHVGHLRSFIVQIAGNGSQFVGLIERGGIECASRHGLRAARRVAATLRRRRLSLHIPFGFQAFLNFDLKPLSARVGRRDGVDQLLGIGVLRLPHDLAHLAGFGDAHRGRE